MKTFLKIVGVIALLIVMAVAAVMYFSSGARDTARAFVIEASSGDLAAAHARLHETLRAEFPMERMEEAFGPAKPYVDVSFGSVETGTGGTRLSGTATTEDGCVSKVEFEVLREQIIAFDITPLCRE